MKSKLEILTAGNMPPNHSPQIEAQAVHQFLAMLLLQNIAEKPPESNHLSRRTAAQKIGTSWSMINNSLEWMQGNGAIFIDRNRITVKQEIMKQIAANQVVSHPETIMTGNPGQTNSSTKDNVASTNKVSKVNINC